MTPHATRASSLLPPLPMTTLPTPEARGRDSEEEGGLKYFPFLLMDIKRIVPPP